MQVSVPTRPVLIIPAYKPSRGLVDLLRAIPANEFARIVVVNDGSGPDFEDTFREVAQMPNVDLLRHAVNLGKGAALKTAFNYALVTFETMPGVVTADADGQHHPEDIVRVAATLMEQPDALVLGAREFGSDVPLRSRFGNIATRGIMHALLGRKLTDTQTGLRGIPAALLPRLLRLESTGYEFELEMLMAAHHLSMTIVETPIRTIYEPGNKSSHFNPVIDSMKIYFVLLRFGSVSLMAALIDNLIFILARSRGLDVLPAQAIGRMVSVTFNYSMVRSSVFYSRETHQQVLPKYLALVLASGTASYAAIRWLNANLGIDPVPAKLMAETVLFFVNFAVQRLFIFKPKGGAVSAPAPRPEAAAPKTDAPPFWGALSAVVLALMLGVAAYGFRTTELFSQEIWLPLGLKRFLNFGGAYLALALPLLLMVPWTFAGVIAALLLVLSTLAIGPLAVLATAMFLLSGCALGSLLLRAKEDSAENHLLATMLGTGCWIVLMTAIVRLPVHYPAVWGALLAAPLVADFRGVVRRFGYWLRGIRHAELRSVPQRAALAFVMFVMIAHWFVALTPESSADGLAMHLAIPLDIAANHRFTFEPTRFIWATMPMGADWCYTIVNLLGGEYAAHLLVWCMLGILIALVYGLLRRLASPAVSLLLVGLFASTPLVQLVTGSLFVENILASMILAMVTALVRFGESGERRYFVLAMALGGMAMQVKVGALAFVIGALVFAGLSAARHWRKLGSRPAVVCSAAFVLLLAAALPPYAIAYRKTGNPVFPFRNPKFASPILERTVDFVDNRYRQPVRWTTLYDLTFHTTDFYEGQRGSFGYQYLLIVPLALLGFPLIRRRGVAAAGWIGFAASILVLRSEPNARYFYAALPLLLVPFAALADWMAANQRIAYRVLMLALIACAALNLWFLPASSYYHKEFSLRQPFSKAARDRAAGEAAPVRDVIAWFNREHSGSAVLFTQDSTIAGAAGEIYENHWHQFPTYQRIREATTVPQVLDVLKNWKIGYFIAYKPGAGEPIKPKQLARLVEVCGIPEYQRGDTYLARLDPACDPNAAAPPVPAVPTVVLHPGFYDDNDPAIVYAGDWQHDQTFAEPARHTVSYNDAAGEEIRFAFEGKALCWIYTKAHNRGIAEITVDGVAQKPLDQYSSAVQWQSRADFCCFTPGKHIMVIRVTGRKHAGSTGAFVDLDALIVE